MKTKIILFSKPSQVTPFEKRPPLSLNNVGIAFVTSYKYLRFTLDQNLDYSLHLKHMYKNINNTAPPYLSEKFVKTDEIHQHRTRAAVNSHFLN